MDGAYRSAILLRVFSPHEIHQSTVVTWMDRYPEIFSVCRDYFIGKPDPRILSYGCATGEEVLTLRSYFPSAFIVGAEINPCSLSVARKRKVDDRIVFLESDPAKIRDTGTFDAIFCLAVLQRTPMRVIRKGIVDLKTIYPFEKFEGKVTELDSLLNRYGLLIIYNSQYSFTDTRVASRYSPLITAKNIHNKGPLFDRNSIRLTTGQTSYSVFVKMRN
ncbi:MAG: class I SAM-dependent methyltransferase [Acidobacteriota bacterium]|nr:class I SAM-dependent methyltransferase [Acidobacteriota bacterium]